MCVKVYTTTSSFKRAYLWQLIEAASSKRKVLTQLCYSAEIEEMNENSVTKYKGIPYSQHDINGAVTDL